MPKKDKPKTKDLPKAIKSYKAVKVVEVEE